MDRRGPTAEMFMNTLATALALALVIVPALSQSAEAAARKHDRDTCQSHYYRGYPLWQRYSN
jgi:hypothetical protein